MKTKSISNAKLGELSIPFFIYMKTYKVYQFSRNHFANFK